jgi:tetratricopeptide (TPR) repeat protein
MDSKKLKQLEEAKVFFYSLRLVESYNILRRFFDRLPFQPEPEHAEYIGIFVRVLVELGKEYELKFYLSELDRLLEKSKNPEIAFQLAVVYLHLADPKIETAKKLIDFVLRDSQSSKLHAKAKLLLVACYNRANDYDSCREVLDSIPMGIDVAIDPLVKIWKAKLLINEQKLNEAEPLLTEIFNSLSRQQDWYPYTSARLLLGQLYVHQKKIGPAKEIRAEVRRMFDGKHFRSIQLQLNGLEELLKEPSNLTTIQLVRRDGEPGVAYSDKFISLKGRGTTKKLLLLLSGKKTVDKVSIVKNLYHRQYDGEKDDKLIYYQIHSLRKCLKSIGLTSQAIVNESEGYRLVPEVDVKGGEPWAGDLDSV